jgi:GNAT superfamily N-acetyltransferase
MAKRPPARNNPAAMATIRKLTRATCDRALPLLEAQYREHRIDMAGARLRKALRELVQGRGLVLLAWDGGPVGVAVLSHTFALEHGGKVTWLDELFVVPERRNQGIGLHLLRKARAAARQSGSRALELEVVEGHTRAARLYLREGFSRLPRTRYSLKL